jgi:hypothetical protein
MEVGLRTIKSVLRDVNIFDWAGISISDGGDVIETSGRRAMSSLIDRRDKTFVRVSVRSVPVKRMLTIFPQYECYIDANRNYRNRPENLVLTKFFGCLERVFSFKIPAKTFPDQPHSLYLVFVQIQSCHGESERYRGMDLAYYRNLGAHEILDLTTVQCVIGRVHVDNRWLIIDRTGALRRSWYNEDE